MAPRVIKVRAASWPLLGLLLMGLLPPAGGALAQTRIADLQRYHAAMRALEDIEEVSDGQRYRAGLFDGLVEGALESLAMSGEACLPSCRCDLRDAISRRLLTDQPAPEGLAMPWLQDTLRREFPCPQAAGQ